MNYTIVNHNDGNLTFNVESASKEVAAEIALNQLGYSVCSNNVQEIETVNVILFLNGDPIRVTSFEDNKDGNEQANMLFRKLALKHGCPSVRYLEDGSYENHETKYSVFLVRSGDE